MTRRLLGRLLIVSHVRVRMYAGHCYLQGGFGRHVDAFAMRFERVHLLTCAEAVDAEPGDYRLRADNVTVVGIPAFSRASKPRRYASILRAAAIAAAKLPSQIHTCDVVHPRLPSVIGGLGALFSRFSSKPVFLYMAGDWEASLLSRGDGPLLKAAAAGLHRALCFLIGDRTCFTAGVGVARRFVGSGKRIVPVMTSAIDREHVVSKNAVLRARREPREILFVGLVWGMKGVFVLLRALKLVRDGGVDARLRIIGGARGDGRNLAREVLALGLDAVVSCEPHMAWDRLIGEYEKSDILVAPSLEGRGEGVPKVILEAMARGVPVIASDVGGVSDLVRHGENGWLVPPGSPEEIARAVRRLWLDAELRARLALAGIRTASSHDLDSLIAGMLTPLSGTPEATTIPAASGAHVA